VQAPGWCGFDGVVGSGTASGAQRHSLGEDNIVVGSGMASRAWGRRLHGRGCHRLGLGEMASRKGGSTVVENNDAGAPWRTRQWHGGSTEELMTARSLRRSMTVQTPGKFLTANFASLTA
jgi:hypothetical protein